MSVGKRGCAWIGLVVILIFMSGCSGSNENNGSNDNPNLNNKALACTSTADDSTQNIDGSASFVHSNTVGEPIYHSVITRKNSLNQDVTVNYMVHEPTSTPKGIVLLIAGGALTAKIVGTEGSVPTSSGGNFLVRSAHRFMQAGYRVITMDRPSDFSNYGNIDNANYLYDAYRTSVDHAIDITTIVNRENSEDLPVFIAGTSRGAISAVAQNTLAMGIAISSPVTVSPAGGAPVGSDALPVDVVEVPVQVLYHQMDGCGASVPANSADLINQFANSGVDVKGNSLTGGFRDTVANNLCGALDYHGFLGIENCAVNTTTTWIDDLLASMEMQHPGNARPVAQSQTTAATMGIAMDITLTATDTDDTDLIFSVPYSKSSLGGTLSLNGDTAHYEAPVLNTTTTTTDTFVFTVIDSKGSRSAAVISVNLSQPPFDHATTTAACSTCHTLPAGHIITTHECDTCHTTSAWLPPPLVTTP